MLNTSTTFDDIKKFTECRPVFVGSPIANNNVDIQDDVSSHDISSDVSDNLIDCCGNFIITFKKYTYKEIEKQINKKLKESGFILRSDRSEEHV